MPKQVVNNVGAYLRFSKDDMKYGDSVSIENQRLILGEYIKEKGWNLHDFYVDDGISGTTFERPGVQRLLDDAKNGIIDTIIVKDLSRFGRNYIQVGQYTDYIFPVYNIRFIAIGDNVDTADTNSAAMDMMPITNVFNEWHSASTSKKLRAVFQANAKAGKYTSTYPAYGYDKGYDELRTPVVDEEAAVTVRRIFEMRAKGYNLKKIADVLNEEKIPTPSDYRYQKLGRPNPHLVTHMWTNANIKRILHNPIYIGKIAQLKTTTVSYKNHKSIVKDEADWVVVDGKHTPIVTQELWDKCREIDDSVSRGKKTKKGVTAPLSGLLYCSCCGTKMRQHSGAKGAKPAYICGLHSATKTECSTHYIKRYLIEEIILKDIQSMISLTVNEEEAKQRFLAKKASLYSVKSADDKRKYLDAMTRISELDKLIESSYEDKVLGKIPEEICIRLLEKYQAERNELESKITEYNKRSELESQDERDAAEFIRRLRKYSNAEELTREMCLELIEYVTVDENNKSDKDRPREIHIYYKLLDTKLNDKRNALL